MTCIQENIRIIEERIGICAKKSGRNKDDITMIAVSKTVDAGSVEQAAKAGIKNFGENRVQEFLKKREVLVSAVNWHIIGPLQRNKVKYILEDVYLLHSLDRLSLAQEIEKQCDKKGTEISALVQINIAKEPTKSGVFEEDLEQLLEKLSVLRRVRIKGLMAIPPIAQNADDNRPYFVRMNVLFNRFKRYFPNNTFEYLSMGMSNDFEAAIEEGSNMVRIGTAVFGARSK
ncbi:MAG: YggS family pyridoxal phosphate-dependent enzyme [Christensenellales bacterium]|jgi:pyridoxal phosphate enzyme (YggS family)